MDLPVSAVLSPAQWPATDWWRRYGDPQLNSLVDLALANNPGLRLAQARIDQAQSITALAGSASEPRADAAATSSRQHFSAHGTTPQPVAGTWNFVTQATIGVQYEFDFWGRNREALSGAIGREHASEIDAVAARLMLATAVVQTYIAIQNVDDEITVEEEQLSRQRDILSLTRRRAQAELDSQIDLKNSLSGIPLRQAAILVLQERRELLAHELMTLLGLPASAAFQIKRTTMEHPFNVVLPSTVPAELIGRRPDVVAQRWRVEAAGHDISAAKASFYPNINLMAMIGLQSLGFEHLDEYGNRIAGVGPAISLPIFDGGRLRAGLSLQNANYDAAIETYNNTVIAALRDVADQLSSMKWLHSHMEEQQQAVSLATEAAELVQQRYRAGLTNYIQVLIAEQTVLQQRRALVDLQAHALSLDAALSRSIGGGLLDPADGPASSNDTDPTSYINHPIGSAYHVN